MQLRGAVLSVVTALAVAAPVAPAVAAGTASGASSGQASVQALKCHTNWENSTSANVWCDGHGPARYGASILCKKGSLQKQLNYGPGPWQGDRRGISMYCPDGGFKRVKQWGWPG
ncbi:hypothetical protein [Streptomyces melanogenes]|uniref:hypothetical protein n=1 Tax=Streptomyces melanogenes TaxID=67326 RepID=UPI003794FD63